MTAIVVRTLGPFSVRIDGAPPPPELLWRKHLALFVYLLRSPRRTRSRDHLIGLLWGDRTDGSARHSLNEALRIVRRVVGREGLRSAGDQVSLAPDLVAVDVDELDAATPEAIDSLIEGEFLEGFSVPDAAGFEEWLAAERRALAVRSIDCLARAARDASARHQDPLAARLAERAFRLDPGSEVAAIAVIRAATTAAGVRAGLAEFDRHRRYLAETAGAAPTPAVQALAARLDRVDQPARSPDLQPRSTRRRPALVGRERMLTELMLIWTEVTAGAAGAALIRGDLGIGKSRLASEVAARVALAGGIVATVRMVEPDRGQPGAALLGLARDRLATAPGAGGAAPASLAALAGSIASWADRFPAVRHHVPAPLEGAFTDLIGSIADAQPVLLIVDDAHWADPASLGGLERLLRDLHDRPVMVLLTAVDRSDQSDLDRISTQLGSDVRGRAVALGPLDAEALDDLVRSALPMYPPASIARLTRRLGADSGGYPLLAIDLLDAITAGLDLERSERTWPATGATLSDTLPGDLPEPVVAAIRIAFRRLSPTAQEVLAASAIGPDRIDPEALAAIIGVPTERVDAALDELEWQRWLAADARGYTFVARITRDVVARDFVTGSQRRRWTRGPAPP